MSDVPIGVLVAVLIVLIALSAFFSSSETGMMALNRYRLRHLVKHRHKGAQRASRLLDRPDRLIGVILLGNNFVNILASAITTIIALRLYGEAGLAIATFLLTLVILIFAEVAPKTLAVLYPERVAFPASIVLSVLLRVMYPLVAVINWLANGLLSLVGVSSDRVDKQQISQGPLCPPLSPRLAFPLFALPSLRVWRIGGLCPPFHPRRTPLWLVASRRQPGMPRPSLQRRARVRARPKRARNAAYAIPLSVGGDRSRLSSGEQQKGVPTELQVGNWRRYKTQ